MRSCDHAIMRSCDHAITPSCDHAITRSCHHAITRSCHHAIMPSCDHAIMPSHHHAIMRSCHHAIMPSCHHTIMRSHHHVIMRSHHHAIMPSCDRAERGRLVLRERRRRREEFGREFQTFQHRSRTRTSLCTSSNRHLLSDWNPRCKRSKDGIQSIFDFKPICAEFNASSTHRTKRAQSTHTTVDCIRVFELDLTFSLAGAIKTDLGLMLICNVDSAFSEALLKPVTLHRSTKWVSIPRSRARACVRALTQAGWCYQMGRGVEKDMSKAVDCYELAASQNYSYSQHQLGVCYAKGKGVEKNYNTAVELFRLAVAQGNSSAQNFLGWCYEYGHGVETSMSEAAKYYRLSADQGNSDAQFKLAHFFKIGTGVGLSFNESLWRYKKAQAQGDRVELCAVEIEIIEAMFSSGQFSCAEDTAIRQIVNLLPQPIAEEIVPELYPYCPPSISF
jgi:TPR repeat protein